MKMIIKPKICEPKEAFSLKRNIQEHLEDYEIKGMRFQDLEEESIQAEKYELRNCVLENCKYIQSNFENTYFLDVIFQNCDFSNSNFSWSKNILILSPLRTIYPGIFIRVSFTNTLPETKSRRIFELEIL